MPTDRHFRRGHLVAGEAVDLRALLRKPLVVNQDLSTLELMAMFRRARPHLALVVDEYGTILGMVTPTDVLETIVGEFPDEAEVHPPVFRREDGSWLVDAQIELPDLEEALGAVGLASGPEFMTVAGLILDRLGRVPRVGEALDINGWRLEVADLDGHRIDQVLITRLPAAQAEA